MSNEPDCSNCLINADCERKKFGTTWCPGHIEGPTDEKVKYLGKICNVSRCEYTQGKKQLVAKINRLAKERDEWKSKYQKEQAKSNRFELELTATDKILTGINKDKSYDPLDYEPAIIREEN